MHFGYLPKSDIETGNLRSDVQLIEAIKTLQRFGHVPPTGHVDADTLALMRRRRCGQPDVTTGSTEFSANNRMDTDLYRRRFKRYAIQGSKWQNTNLKWR